MTQSIIGTLPIAQSDAARKLTEFIDKLSRILPATAEVQQFAFAAVSEANKLVDCEPSSVVLSAYHAALLGLIPGGALGLAYFIPFRQKGRPLKRCQLIVGYRGYIDLAIGSGFLLDIHADVVLEGEPFEHYVTEEGVKLKHVIGIRGEWRKPQVLAAYCIYSTRGGGRGIRVVPRSEIDKVDKKQDVWIEHYDSMAMKTAVRRAAKEWPATNRLALAIRLDEAAEAELSPAEAGLPTIEELPRGEQPLDLDTLDDKP